MSINTKKYIEEFLKIKNKETNIVPFKLNEPQLRFYNLIKELKEKQVPIRIIILKARQMGFSTLTEGILFKETVTHHNVSAGIISHTAEATNNIFNITNLFYNELPNEIKPQKLKSNSKELIFNTKDNRGLNSKITCMTAGTSDVGRSATYNILHLSEFAFWPGDKKKTYTGLIQTVPKTSNSMIIIESTANGYEFYQELWDMAKKGENDFVPFFIGWNELSEYRMPYNGFELTDEEKTLKEIYSLDNEQIAWRRWCIRTNCSNDINLFRQEYPICPEEAFMLSGETVFDTEIIMNRMKTLDKPLKTGYFLYDFDDSKEGKEKFSNIRFIRDSNGYINIYKLPNQPKFTKYCLGGDTAGNGSDNFTGHVLDAETGEQVAVLKRKYDPDLYVKQMYCLGYYYGWALIGIEANFDTFPNMELQRFQYPNIYVRERIDNYTKKKEKKYGFLTTSSNRNAIIGRLIQIVREESNLINDYDTLEELRTIIRNKDSRIEAPPGGHDDQMMGLAIAHQIKDQVVFDNNTITSSIDDFFEKKEIRSDYGEKIKVI